MHERPLIVDIKRHSLEDGPGIRSVVFFKGCPLRCVFCHNPEAQEPGPEISFSSGECVSCGACAAVCPTGAISLDLPDRIDRRKCRRCGECARVCPGEGLRRIGTFYRVEDLAEQLLRDRAFYRHSRGGVTLSGGECTLYPDYVEALLRCLRQAGAHVVLQTSGFFSYETFRRKILPHLDLVCFDLKLADSDLHARYTGRSNRRILENFRRLIREAPGKVLARIPLIPQITATRENLAAIAALLRREGIHHVELLPYNPLGTAKRQAIGLPPSVLPQGFMPQDEIGAIARIFDFFLR